ncbi:Protein RTF2-like protein [Smittium mucronatum]|uniref:Protein RTF2-like protein n=1 Tax=Smittium mucronatum TaxID=133383 RepID=A0A1R0H3M7_9FUNG|nr:Protein RTF2-like protein [Smittium mucronatum]
MGNDGGSIPKRSELVQLKAKKEKADTKLQAISKWFFCALSKLPLSEPIVSDKMGKLYNKESILKYLLDKEGAFGDADNICWYIKSMKQVKELTLTKNPDFSKKRDLKTPSSNSEYYSTAQFICPILQKEMNGKVDFCYMWECGCVMSEEAAALTKTDVCLNCGKNIVRDNIVTLNPSPEKSEEMLEKLLKNIKSKKSKNNARLNNHTEKFNSTKDETKSLGTEIPLNMTKIYKNEDGPNKKRKHEPAKIEVGKAIKVATCSIPSSRIIEQYGTSFAGSKDVKSNPVLNSIFLNEDDRKKSDKNKNFLFKGTFNRYVS